jgi:hypothetical protein
MYILFFLFFAPNLNAQDDKDALTEKQIDSLFKFHLSKLDSTASANKKDTFFICCPYSIEFIEKSTDIYSRSDMNFAGKWKFFKSDLLKWHNWYEMNKSNLIWDNKLEKIISKKD